MLSLRNLSMSFPEKILLENVNVDFDEGKLTAMIGRNGTGKSTLLNALCGLNDKYTGEILLRGEALKKIPRRKLSTMIAYVGTQRMRIPNLRCRDVVALGRSPYTSWQGKLSGKDKAMVDNAFRLVGMDEYKDRYINTLSDGESQKIMIARAIAQDTPIIILDEPTSFLDLPSRHELVGLLKKLTEEEGKTIIFSTHELDIAKQYSDRIAHLHDGTVEVHDV